MIPSNVVSFVKKMVTSDSTPASGASNLSSSYGRNDGGDVTTPFSKLKHTLTSGLQGTVTRLSPACSTFGHDSGISSSTSSLSSGAVGALSSSSISSASTVSSEDRSILQRVWDKTEKYDSSDRRGSKVTLITTSPTVPLGSTYHPISTTINGGNSEGVSLNVHSKVNRQTGSTCRVCVKALSENEYFRRCSECCQKVCEDCASYSAGDEMNDIWYCSICKRKLSSRAKKEIPETQPTPEIITMQPFMSGKCAIPGMSSQLGIKAIGSQSIVMSLSSAVGIHSQLINAAQSAKLKDDNSNNLSCKDKTTQKRVPNKLGERSFSKEGKDSHKGSTKIKDTVRGKDKPPVTRRRSENEEEMSTFPEAISLSKGHRASDYKLPDYSDHSNEHHNIVKSKHERDSQWVTALQRPTDLSRNSTTSTDVQIGSVDSSGDERSPDGRRGRRKSIVRQKSYDEDIDETNYLSLWNSGNLPNRRHSSQDPGRRIDHPELHRSKESLDIPQGRVHRHHSWDYDISRGSNNKTPLILSPSVSYASRINNESDNNNDRSNIMSHEEQIQKAQSVSTNRRSSYRAARGSQEDRMDSYVNEQANADLGRKSGSSSLEDAPRLHPNEDEWRTTRRRSSAISDSNRVLPTPPASPRVPSYSNWGSAGSAGKHSSQSVESTGSRDNGDDIPGRQSSVADGETIKIVIHDVDLAQASEEETSRTRITLHRKAGGGLGMRVIGGKQATDGKLYAHVVWTVGGGPAECAGIKQGDKIIEWNNVSLINRNFEDVSSIIEADETKGAIDVLVESSNDQIGLEFADHPSSAHRGSFESRGSIDSDLEKSLVSYSRRKLPKIPGDILRSPVSGKVQAQLWFDKNTSQLITTILSAHDLRLRDGYSPPEAFVCMRLFPHGDRSTFSTNVADPSAKPLWNSVFVWENLSGDALLGMTLELSVWDFIIEGENGFLGECLIDLRHAYLDERPSWYRLQERRSRSANTTPRGSIVGYEIVLPTVRRPSSVKSGSEDFHDIDDSRHSSVDSGLLHPDLAYRDSRSNSRRGSSLSEQAENEIYQLTRSYPHSLPQSRRSSFAHQTASPEFRVEDLEARLSVMPSVERRRAQSVRVTSQRELLKDAGWRDLNQMPQWLSNSASFYTSSQSAYYPSQQLLTSSRSNSLKGDQILRKGSCKSNKLDEDRGWRTSLGPGQVVPRAYRAILTDDFTLGEIRLELSMTRGNLEIEVSNARRLPESDSGQPPDTYVKTYLKDGDKKINKKKTRVIKQSQTPNFYQSIRYSSPELPGRTLLVMVWEKARGFDHNIPLGVAEIAINKLELRRPITGWYRLLPPSSVERSDESSDSN